MGPSGEPEYYEPERLCAVILHELKRIASLHEVNSSSQQTVIAVPQAFNEEQQQAIKLSCQLAGLNI